MRIRPFKPEDWPILKELYAKSEFWKDNDLPDFNGKTFIVTHVIVDENDRPVMAAGARLTAEVHLLADSSWATPRWRMEALRTLHDSVQADLRDRGIEDAHIFVHPSKVKTFGRRLMRCFGWKKPTCIPFWREVA